MIHLGEGIILIGVLAMIFPFENNCFNRTYPHRTWMCTDLPIHYSLNPAHFGADKSQSIIGVQMAFAYIGTCLMPPFLALLQDP